MSGNTTTYRLNFTSNGQQIFATVEEGYDNIRNSTEKATKAFGESFKSLLSFSLALEGVQALKGELDNLVNVGIDLNTQMADLSAITGLTDEGLKKIEASARQSAKTFGTEATQNVESYKLILSQLSPEIANNDKALSAMGNNVNVLSKTMGGDTVAATNVLTTAMNQYGVALDDPIAASKIMADMMNVMAAGAKEGSAELPEIKNALEQSGMAAKAANVSFVETNAAIQVLDKAGKKGSEGGVALRNVLATLSQGRFLPKDTQKQLKSAGVDINNLTDLSKPLTDRLQALQPIMNDNALVTKLFGKENNTAALALLNNVKSIEDLKGKMTNTNTAIEQADIVMGSYGEKMKRTKAIIDDLKIGIFNASKSFLPYIENTMTAMGSIGQLAVSINALKTVYESFNFNLISGVKTLWRKIFVTNADTAANTANTASMGIGGKIATWFKTKIFTVNRQMSLGVISSFIFSKAIKGVRNAMLQATLATRAFSISIMSIPIIGWIIAAITAVVIGLKALWDHSKRFREILFGIWEAGKVVFNNIGIVLGRVYNLFIKPIANFIGKSFSIGFIHVKNAANSAWEAISNGALWIYDSVLAPVANAFRIGFVYSFEVIAQTSTQLWNWITNTFSGFFEFINTQIVEPIRSVFDSLWNWISNLLNNIFSKFEGILAPIRAIWNSIFSSDGMDDVEVAYREGEKKGAESFEKDNPKKTEEKEISDASHKSIFDVSKGGKVPATNNIGGVALKQAEKNKSSSQGGSRVSSLIINKLIETMNINYSGTSQSKTQLKKDITEILLTVLADSTNK